MQRIACTVLLLVLLAGNVPVGAAGIDVMGGTSFHNPVAAQIGDHYIENPQWRTRPFEDAYYYSIRIRWAGNRMVARQNIFAGSTGNRKF